MDTLIRNIHPKQLLVGLVALVLVSSVVAGTAVAEDRAVVTREEKIRSRYAKFEKRIPMRDGVHLYTSIYVPYTVDRSERFPIILVRTPYSAGPYGANEYRTTLGPSETFEDEGYIFAFQDVRGRYMSEGEFENMRPHLPNKIGKQIDESSDTYDTIEWLVKNIPENNGRVGQWGISYPGFYSSAGCIDSHPALKAVSPQAPIADWFFDDFHRNGAFVLPMGFGFFSSFGQPRPEPTPLRASGFDFPTRDGYQFYLDLGPLKNVNTKYFGSKIDFWNSITSHPNYDDFWKARNLLPHLKNIHANVLVVGGWFDTEDLYGPLKTYEAIESQNKDIHNTLVMGPWYHGGWNRTEGRKLGEADFEFATAELYRDEIEAKFFHQALKEGMTPELPEAFVFETGANRWRTFEHWPPRQTESKALRFQPSGSLQFADVAGPTKIVQSEAVGRDRSIADGPLASLGPSREFSSWISDPAKPVPYTQEVTTRWSRDYMTEDQRFAGRRPDVLVFQSDVLEEDITIAGPLTARVFFSTTGGDADLIVKLIDEFPGQPPTRAPGDEVDPEYPSGRQQLVRAGVMRGRFRNDFSTPIPMTSGEIVEIRVPLRDILHTFKRGHRIMIQVQSTWFPFIDRNPQTWVENIFEAEQSDFAAQLHRLFHNEQFPSEIQFQQLK